MSTAHRLISSKRSPFAERKKQRGFSLVELIIALGLGSLIGLAIVQLFVSNNQTNAILNGQSRMQENARLALDFIMRDARSAGYIGCAPDPDKIVSMLNGDFDNLFEYNVTSFIEAFEGGDPGDGWTPTLNNLPRTVGGANVNVYIPGNGIDITTIEPGTDVLVMRGIEVPGVPLASVVSAAGDPQVYAPGGVLAEIQDEQIVMISDCLQATMFRVTDIGIAGEVATLEHVSTGGGLYENRSSFNLTSGAGEAFGSDSDAVVSPVRTIIYYVADGTGTNNRGDAPLSLWRKDGSDAPVELIEGVEDLEVTFGIDNTAFDNVRNAAQYVDYDDIPLAGGVPDVGRIVTMRVQITANSVNEVIDDGTGLLSRDFTHTIHLRNTNPSS